MIRFASPLVWKSCEIREKRETGPTYSLVIPAAIEASSADLLYQRWTQEQLAPICPFLLQRIPDTTARATQAERR